MAGKRKKIGKKERDVALETIKGWLEREGEGFTMHVATLRGGGRNSFIIVGEQTRKQSS